MQKNTDHEAHIEEFVGKYESRNPISRLLIDNFYKNVKSILPNDVTEVLEVGCGAGYSTQWIYSMLPTNARYTASDIEEDLIALAKKRVPHVIFSKESIFDLPYDDNSKDLVICLETLEHVEGPEVALREILRVTKRYALVSVPREPLWRILNICRGSYIWDLGNTPGHINHWSQRSFKKFATKNAILKNTKAPIPWTILLLEKK